METSRQRRLARLREAMAEQSLEAVVLQDTYNIHWVTDFDDVFDEERAHRLFVTSDRAVLHTDSRYAEALFEAARGTEIEVDVTPGSPAKFLVTLLQRLAEEDESVLFDGVVTLGVEDTMPLIDYRRLVTALSESPATPVVIRETRELGLGLRAVKDGPELERIRAAQAITDAAFQEIVKFIDVGMTERQIKRQLEETMLRLGADAVAFPSIVAVGPNAAKPHSIAGATFVTPGQCLLLDFGAVVDDYRSDMTRTIAVGDPSEEFKRAYTAVFEVNQSIEDALRPGMTCREADELANGILAAAGYEGRMGHALGHGVGLQTHELPILSKRSDAPLEIGNVVTVEPGVYFPDQFGIRIEDMGVVTASGFKCMTETSRDLLII